MMTTINCSAFRNEVQVSRECCLPTPSRSIAGVRDRRQNAINYLRSREKKAS